MRTFLAPCQVGLSRDLTLTALAQKPGAGDLTLGAHRLGQMLALFLSGEVSVSPGVKRGAVGQPGDFSINLSQPRRTACPDRGHLLGRVVAVLIAAVARSSSRRLALKA